MTPESTESTPATVEPVDTIESLEQEGAALREKLVADPVAATPQSETPPAEPEQPEAAQPEQPEPTQPTEPTQQETKYAKAKKDAERKDKSWKALEAEKELTRKEQAEIQRQRAEFAANVRQYQQQQQSQRQQQDNGRFSPEEFERATDWYEKEAEKALQDGDLDKYRELNNNAKLTRRASKDAATKHAQAQQQQQQAEFVQQYEASFLRVVEKDKDAGDPDTETGKKIVSLFQEFPILQAIPNGFEVGYELLKMRDKATGYDATAKERDDWKRRAEEAEAKLQPGAGGPASPIATIGNSETMPLDQLEKHLRNRAYAGEALVK